MYDGEYDETSFTNEFKREAAAQWETSGHNASQAGFEFAVHMRAPVWRSGVQDTVMTKAMQGDELRTIRKVMSMTQGDLAAVLDMVVQSVGRMERVEMPIERRTGLAIRYLSLHAGTSR